MLRLKKHRVKIVEFEPRGTEVNLVQFRFVSINNYGSFVHLKHCLSLNCRYVATVRSICGVQHWRRPEDAHLSQRVFAVWTRRVFDPDSAAEHGNWVCRPPLHLLLIFETFPLPWAPERFKSGMARVEKRTQQAWASRHQRRLGCGMWGGGVPLPSRLRVWGSVVSSPSGVRGRAPAANAFLSYLGPQNVAGGDKNSIYLN